MFKMVIAFDEKRISATSDYTISELQDWLRQTMAAANIEQQSPGTFIGKGDKDDFSRFGSAIIMLKRKKWFLPFVEKWLWYTDTGVEDVAAHYRRVFRPIQSIYP